MTGQTQLGSRGRRRGGRRLYSGHGGGRGLRDWRTGGCGLRDCRTGGRGLRDRNRRRRRLRSRYGGRDLRNSGAAFGGGRIDEPMEGDCEQGIGPHAEADHRHGGQSTVSRAFYIHILPHLRATPVSRASGPTGSSLWRKNRLSRPSDDGHPAPHLCSGVFSLIFRRASACQTARSSAPPAPSGWSRPSPARRRSTASAGFFSISQYGERPEI
jgi:hypothetical protein